MDAASSFTFFKDNGGEEQLYYRTAHMFVNTAERMLDFGLIDIRPNKSPAAKSITRITNR